MFLALVIVVVVVIILIWKPKLTVHLRNLIYVEWDKYYPLLSACFLIRTVLQGLHSSPYSYVKWVEVRTDCHLTPL